MLHPLDLLDRLAGWWMDFRTDQAVKALPADLQEFRLKRANVEDGTLQLVMTSPAIVFLADQAADLLDRENAENFVVFDMMPRLDRGKRPITVTVAWAGKKSTSQVISELRARIAELEGK